MDRLTGTSVLFGYEMPTPGPDPRSLERLALRALREGVRLTPEGQPGRFRAWRPGSSSVYVTSARRCSCPAGSHGRPCKHLSLVVLIELVLASRPRGP